MSDPESRIIGFGIAGSVAVHLLAALTFACWVAFAPAPVMKPHPSDPPVEVILPENIQLVATPTPAPPPEPEPKPEPPKPRPSPRRFIDTADNTPTENAPNKAGFISDRSTTASTKMAADKNGDQPLPTSDGVKVSTLDMANRDYRPGEIKDERANATPLAPPPLPANPQKTSVPKPQPEEKKLEEPPPPDKVAKKEDAPAEKMMKELDAALLKEKEEGDRSPPPSVPKAKAVNPADKTPDMKLPDESLLPTSPPLPPPVPATPKPPETNEFAPEKRTSRTKGSVSKIGAENAVDAVETAEGRYRAKVKAAIGERWLFHKMRQGDFVQPCDILVQVYLTRDGKPTDVRIISSNGNAVVTDFTLGSILEAKIPPIPEELRNQMSSDLFEMPMEFLIY